MEPVPFSGLDGTLDRLDQTMHSEQFGPYKIIRELGRGGMGTVFEALDTESGEPVAIKVLAHMMSADSGFRERFEAEINSLKKLKHPNIVRLFGYGEQNGSLYYAMELVDSTNLEDELQSGKRFNWKEVADLAIQISRALKHAHDHGVIHRDIKPANLLITEGQIKLTDFGIARLYGNTGITVDGGVLGTAEYMSPEQAEGRPATHHCDLYSLGGVMYSLLAGRPPFVSKSLPELLQMQRFSEHEPVSRYAHDTPAPLEQIIDQLLEKQPEKRFPNASVLVRRLEDLQHQVMRQEQKIIIDASNSGEKSTESTQADLKITDVQGLAEDARRTAVDKPKSKEDSSGADGDKLAVENRFTRVEDDPARGSRKVEAEPSALRSPQTWILALALLAMIVGVWYINARRIRSEAAEMRLADELYDKIDVAVQQGEKSKLLIGNIDENINEFTRRFPEDSRIDRVLAYREQIRSKQTPSENKTLLQIVNQIANKSPIGRAVTDALRATENDLEAGIKKLQAVINLYENSASSEKDQDSIDLAKEVLDRSRKHLAAFQSEDRKVLQQRLEHAEKLREAEPDEAKKIWQAIVDLYQDKPWASEEVLRAKAALADLPGLHSINQKK